MSGRKSRSSSKQRKKSRAGRRLRARVESGRREEPGGRLWDDDGERESGRERWLSSPIEDLNLSMCAYNVLRRSGLITVGLILRQTEDELLCLRNLGRKGYDDIRGHLDELGIVPMDADWDTAHGVN